MRGGSTSADQISVLRMGGEGFEMQPADTEKHAARRRAEGLRGGRRASSTSIQRSPVARRHGGRSSASSGTLGFGAGGDGVSAHLRRERVGGVDDAIDPFGAQIAGKTLDAAKAADAPRNGRRRRVFGTAGVGQHRIDARFVRHRMREPVGVGGAAEDKEPEAFGGEGCHDRKP